jgi:ribosomal-protein-alanine N-acetyltransferase
VVIRAAREEDRAAIAAIQAASPEAPRWDPAGYDVTVADFHGEVVGFLVIRRTAPDELEVLNLAVAPGHRRTGVARALLQPLLTSHKGVIFLEVRESNSRARLLYQSIGFKEVTYRREYYSDPSEGAIVMNFHSC